MCKQYWMAALRTNKTRSVYLWSFCNDRDIIQYSRISSYRASLIKRKSCQRCCCLAFVSLFDSVSLNIDTTSSVSPLALDSVTKHTNTKPHLSFPPPSAKSNCIAPQFWAASFICARWRRVKIEIGAGEDEWSVKRGGLQFHKGRRRED